MLQKKSKKWPKLQISQHQFWGSKTPNSPVVECWLDVKPPISKPHQGWNYFPKCHERLCLILRNLVILSRIKDLDVNYADYSKEGGSWENLEISRFDQTLMMGRLPPSDLARQLSLWTKTMGSKPHRIGMMTILNNSCHFLADANLTEMPELRVEEQISNASVGNGSISNILASIDCSSIDEEMIHSSSLRPLTSLRL